ncbi:MAG TPA: hypothetical protein VGQ00_04175 [Candidatus Norongarragalinales archaeon]|jgi:hypothetical protein|nr:hypothetical protein [Candidatus Norongarragalinales archaeon]
MKQTIFFLILVGVIVLGATAVAAWWYLTPFAVKTYSSSVTVLPAGRYLALNTDTDGIRFGKIPQGAQGERTVIITNNSPRPLRAVLEAKGDIARFISVSNNNFVIPPNQGTPVIVYAIIPTNAPEGNYTGYLKATLWRT